LVNINSLFRLNDKLNRPFRSVCTALPPFSEMVTPDKGPALFFTTPVTVDCAKVKNGTKTIIMKLYNALFITIAYKIIIGLPLRILFHIRVFNDLIEWNRCQIHFLFKIHLQDGNSLTNSPCTRFVNNHPMYFLIELLFGDFPPAHIVKTMLLKSKFFTAFVPNNRPHLFLVQSGRKLKRT